MGMLMDEANPAQKQFLECMRQDPDKGEQWMKLFDMATAGFAVIAAMKEIDPAVSALMIPHIAAEITRATDSVYPHAVAGEKNPRAIELRTDVVNFMALDAEVLPEGSRWDEKSRQIVSE